VTKNGQPVKGSPIEIDVSPDPAKQSRPTVGNPCEVNLAIPEVNLPQDLDDLHAEVSIVAI
jgi:hypothetical protein